MLVCCLDVVIYEIFSRKGRFYDDSLVMKFNMCVVIVLGDVIGFMWY